MENKRENDREIAKEVERQLRLLEEGTVEIVPREELRSKLTESVRTGRPLRVKQGIDPTSPDVHIGHMVPYRKMRQFQDLGHEAVLIIGDYTARIGDPTGRNSERPPLDAEQVRENAETYTNQIFKIVDPDRAEVRRQSEWFDGVSLLDTVGLMAEFSVAQMLAHDTFRRRLDDGRRLSVHELLYPVLQAYDSVVVKADVELGGTDQKFNCLCGRELMRDRALEPQVVICMPLLPGSDGLKMSKSAGNHIPVTASAAEMYGKVMSLPDESITMYMMHCTGIAQEEIVDWERKLTGGTVNPKDAKMRVAYALAKVYHGHAAAETAANEFSRVFSADGLPDQIETRVWRRSATPICTLLKETGLVKSTSEGRRLVEQGGVSIDGVRITDPGYEFMKPGAGRTLLRVGKRRFLHLEVES